MFTNLANELGQHSVAFPGEKGPKKPGARALRDDAQQNFGHEDTDLGIFATKSMGMNG
jgi:hypothetical protein